MTYSLTFFSFLLQCHLLSKILCGHSILEVLQGRCLINIGWINKQWITLWGDFVNENHMLKNIIWWYHKATTHLWIPYLQRCEIIKFYLKHCYPVLLIHTSQLILIAPPIVQWFSIYIRITHKTFKLSIVGPHSRTTNLINFGKARYYYLEASNNYKM